MSRTYTKAEYEALERKMKKGWAMYYEKINEMADMANTIFSEFSVGVDEDNNLVRDFPVHISDEFFDMCKKLHKDYNCVICLELVEKGKFKMTWCGHTYCQACFDKVKEQYKVCSICKKKL